MYASKPEFTAFRQPVKVDTLSDPVTEGHKLIFACVAKGVKVKSE
jgi:hypothetical protein